MAGETLAGCHVGVRGLLGDRAFAVVDAGSGRVASGKHPRKWGALLGVAAKCIGPLQPALELPPINLRFPDGTTASTDDPGIDGILSGFLGRPARLAGTPPVTARIERVAMEVEEAAGETVTDGSLAAAAPGTFFDHSPVHVLTTATLRALAGPH